MKKVLFFLLLSKISFAQVDSTALDSSIVIHDALHGEVVVSATRANENSPTTFQVISKEELNKNNLGQDLPYLLDLTPSVVTSSDAGTGVGYTYIHIRGSDNTRVNVTLNGIPVNDAASQGVYWVDIPDVVSSTQNIQIQRGVGTSTNGPGAFGGTISVQTQAPSQTAFGALDISGGSFNTFKGTAKAGTGNIKGFFAEGSASWITSDGYIQRASANLRSYFFQTGYLKKNTLLKFIYFGGREKTYQAWDGVPQDSLKTNRTFNDLGTDYGQHFPPYKNQTDNYAQDYFQLLFSQYLPKNFNLNLGLFATLGRGYYEEYKVGQDINSYIPNYDTVPVVMDLVRQKWLKNIFYGGTFALNYEHNNFAATVGGLFSQFAGNNYGNVIWIQVATGIDPNFHYYNGPSTKNDFDVYAKFNYDLLRKVNFYLDLQYRYVNYKSNGTNDDLSPYDVNNVWHFFNPKVGILYRVKPNHHLYASFAIGNREPNRDDILAATAGNEPKAEQMRDLELGYKTQLTKNSKVQAMLNINYFLMHYKDQLVLTGRLNDVGSPIKENVPISYRTGIELAGKIDLTARTKHSNAETEIRRKVFSINYTFTYSLNKIKAFDEYIYTYDENYVPIDSLTLALHHKNTDISFSPSIIASLELVAYPVKGLSISLMNKAVSRQYLDNTSNPDRMLKAFYYSNINISYTLPLNKPNKEITFKLLLNNIFNRLYESNGYTYSERYAYLDNNGAQQVTPTVTYNYYSPQAGFNVMGGMSVRF